MTPVKLWREEPGAGHAGDVQRQERSGAPDSERGALACPHDERVLEFVTRRDVPELGTVGCRPHQVLTNEQIAFDIESNTIEAGKLQMQQVHVRHGKLKSAHQHSSACHVGTPEWCVVIETDRRLTQRGWWVV